MIQKRTSQVTNWLIIAIFFFPILPLPVSGTILILMIITGLIDWFSSNGRSFKVVWPFVPIAVIGTLYLINVLWATETKVAWFEFEKRAAMLAVPLFVGIKGKVSPFVVKWSKWAFISSVTVLSLILITLYARALFLPGPGLSTNFFFELRTTFESVAHIHPTYYGLFAGASVLLLIDLFFQVDLDSKTKRWYWVLIAICAIGLLLSGARMAAASSAVAVSVYLLTQSKYKILILLTILAIPVIWFTRQILAQRFMDIYNLLVQNGESVSAGTGVRLFIFHCDIQLLRNFWLFGLGSDGVQTALNFCYSLTGIDLLQQHQYNSHNEYLNLWLTYGVLGITLLLSYFVFMFRKSGKSPLLLGFTLLVALQLLTENLLARQHGLFFVLLFTTVFLIGQPKKDEKPIARKVDPAA